MHSVPHPTVAAAARVLVVDDEPGVVSFIARALRTAGFEVDVAGSGQAALDMAERSDYAVVLLDLRMPSMSGVVVLKHLSVTQPHVKVVVVSAAADTQIKVRCLELGATDFVAKPFELAELVARVGAHARIAGALAPPRPETVVRAGRFVLDLERSTVDAGDGPIPLPVREMRLLRHLMRRAGEACSREELLREAWDTSFDAGTNVVDVCVHRLRQKLGAGAVETVRNVGYRLVV
jgi:DNA-binding response OmpR family regulator